MQSVLNDKKYLKFINWSDSRDKVAAAGQFIGFLMRSWVLKYVNKIYLSRYVRFPLVFCDQILTVIYAYLIREAAIDSNLYASGSGAAQAALGWQLPV